MNVIHSVSILNITNKPSCNKISKTENKTHCIISCHIKGTSTIKYNNENIIVHPGDILYVPSGTNYDQECNSEETISFHLCFYGNPCDEIKVFNPHNPIEICEIFKNSYLTWEKKKQSYYYLCLSDLYKIIANMASIFSCKNTNFSPITPSINYIRLHIYDATFSLKVACQQSFVSPSTFNKHFKKHFNCSPKQFVIQTRIQKAKMLLETNLYTREEIANLCGYDNVKYFYVIFKQITGMTTGEYIKQL